MSRNFVLVKPHFVRKIHNFNSISNVLEHWSLHKEVFSSIAYNSQQLKSGYRHFSKNWNPHRILIRDSILTKMITKKARFGFKSTRNFSSIGRVISEIQKLQFFEVLTLTHSHTHTLARARAQNFFLNHFSECITWFWVCWHENLEKKIMKIKLPL